MTLSNMLRAGLLAATLIALPGNSAAPDPDTLINADLRVISKDGTNYGCEFGADVARRGVPEAQQDRISFSLTQLRITPTRTARGLKLGYFAPGATTEAAPAGVLLVSDTGDNQTEINGTKLSDTPGYRLTAFRGGPQTVRAYESLADIGRFAIKVTLDDGTSRVWTIDLSSQRNVRDRWAKCVLESQPLEAD